MRRCGLIRNRYNHRRSDTASFFLLTALRCDGQVFQHGFAWAPSRAWPRHQRTAADWAPPPPPPPPKTRKDPPPNPPRPKKKKNRQKKNTPAPPPPPRREHPPDGESEGSSRDVGKAGWTPAKWPTGYVHADAARAETFCDVVLLPPSSISRARPISFDPHSVAVRTR